MTDLYDYPTDYLHTDMKYVNNYLSFGKISKGSP